MKKNILFVLAAFSFLLLSCDKEVDKFVEVTSISIVNKINGMTIGDTYKFEKEYLPKESVETIVYHWASSNTSVISVDGTGSVKALKSGEAKILLTASLVRNQIPCEFTDEVEIHVVSTELQGLKLSENFVELMNSKEYKLYVSVIPETSEAKSLEWSSSDDAIVRVNNNGLIKGMKVGEAVVTVREKNTNISTSCNVKITPIPLIELSFSESEIKLLIGETDQTTPVFKPENTDLKNVSYESYDESIVTISENGVITGVSKGQTSVLVKSEDGKLRGICNVTVESDNDRIKIQKSGTLIIINGWVTGTVNLMLLNNSSKTIIVKNLKIISQNVEVYNRDLNENLESLTTYTHSIQIYNIYNLYNSTYTYTYTLDGKSYEISLEEK